LLAAIIAALWLKCALRHLLLASRSNGFVSTRANMAREVEGHAYIII
jgi:hypothetical protein